MMDDPTDPDLYRLACRAREGDREALGLLIERARLRLFATAWAELHHYDDAQDAIASALARICLHVEDLRKPDRIELWMRRIVRNEARMLARRRRVRPEERYDDLEVRDESEPERRTALRQDILHALTQVPREQSYVLALHYLTGLSVAEIAHRCNRPEGTVKRWLYEGRNRLATQLKEYAPMEMQEQEKIAAIVSTELEADYVRGLEAALITAGFDRVLPLSGLPALTWKGKGGTLEYHLPPPLQEAKLIVLDEWVGGRSAFELYVMLRATTEGKQAGICQLLSSPSDATVFAAWAAGCDMCFTRETLDPQDFARLVAKWLGQT